MTSGPHYEIYASDGAIKVTTTSTLIRELADYISELESKIESMEKEKVDIIHFLTIRQLINGSLTFKKPTNFSHNKSKKLHSDLLNKQRVVYTCTDALRGELIIYDGHNIKQTNDERLCIDKLTDVSLILDI